MHFAFMKQNIVYEQNFSNFYESLPYQQLKTI